ALVVSYREVRGGQLLDRRDERLGDEPSAVRTVIAARVGIPRAEDRSASDRHGQCRMSNAECRMPKMTNGECRTARGASRGLSGRAPTRHLTTHRWPRA